VSSSGLSNEESDRGGGRSIDSGRDFSNRSKYAGEYATE
jgi:hypothetical protein